MSAYKIINADCMDAMQAMDSNSIDAVVTDPPYGLSFMGKAWDKGVPSCEVWKGALRVLKPGGHLLAFAGTRTQHRMACAIEDAGFEIRDMIAWVYGSGFPKSHDVSKAIDKAAGAEREKLRPSPNRKPGHENGKSWKQASPDSMKYHITAPATEAAKQWDGWGSALKPALEPITVARKPLAKGSTIAANVLEYGTGAINVDGCRVGSDGGTAKKNPPKDDSNGINGACDIVDIGKGRWPANLIHDGSQGVLDLFPETNRSSAALFFYCAKASKRDRDEGLTNDESRHSPMGYERGFGDAGEGMFKDRNTLKRNSHPTVKPTDLMRYLVRLVTPRGGTVLDPFAGSGSTGKAAALEGFGFIGIELEPEYVEIAKERINHVGGYSEDDLL